MVLLSTCTAITTFPVTSSESPVRDRERSRALLVRLRTEDSGHWISKAKRFLTSFGSEAGTGFYYRIRGIFCVSFLSETGASLCFVSENANFFNIHYQ